MARRVGLSAAVRTTAVAVAAAVAFGAAGGMTFANFAGTASSAGPTVSTKRIFTGARTTSAWDIHDQSGGVASAVDTSGALAFADTPTARTTTTGSAWLTAFSLGRYLEFRMNSALPGGIPVTGAAFNFNFATTVGGTTANYYFDVRDGATGTVVLATHGSQAAPIGSASTTLMGFTTTLPELTNSDLVNGVRIRVYLWTPGAPGTTSRTRTDVATVSGTGYAPFVMYPASYTDVSGGAVSAPWELAGADGVAYQSANVWPTSLRAARYIDLTFPAYVPTGASITQVQFTHTFKDISATNPNQAYFYEVVFGGTVIATYGSLTTPFTSNATNGFLTFVINLPEVDTVPEANGVVIRMHGSNTGGGMGGRYSLEDAGLLSVTYSLT